MPTFDSLLENVYTKSPLQKKKIEKHLAKQDAQFFEDAKRFTADYTTYLERRRIPVGEAIDSYLELCRNMMMCQIEFLKTGEYPVKRMDNVVRDVYHNEKAMTSHMIGLAISQFLWETHYAMYRFFSETIQSLSPRISAYFEIGPGHGLFLKKAWEYLRSEVTVDVVDISPTSIEITKAIVNHFHLPQSINYFVGDMLEFTADKKYDFIAMGEVLEHVHFPEKLLKKLSVLLNPGGHAFISTCANAPSIDHVYHYHDVDEIRAMVRDCGFVIQRERVLPVEDLPMEEIVRKKVTVNYCAIIRKAHDER